MVTRENARDKRYGLAKSLSPVVEQLQKQGLAVRYVSQADLTARNVHWIERLTRGATKVASLLLPDCLAVLTGGVIQRLNMGRVAAKIARREGYTHVHCHDPIICAGALLFSFRRSFRCGVTQHGFGSYSQAIHEDGAPMTTGVMRLMRRWEASTLAKCDWVVSPTIRGLKQLSRDLSVHPVPQHWVAITHPKPSMELCERSLARAELRLSPDKVYILAVGRIVPLKDFHTLLAACSRLKLKQDWSLIILGDGDWDAIRREASELGLADDALILAATDQPGQWYSAADLYVSTSTTESFGMANHEALCAGLPAILTAVAAVPEAAGMAPVYIPESNVEAVHKALNELITSASARAYRAEQSLSLSSQWPTTDAIADAYIDCYNGRFRHLTAPR